MIVHVYCSCDNQQPEEVKRGVYRCMNCHNDIPADDFSEAPEIELGSAADYERERYETVTEDYYHE